MSLPLYSVVYVSRPAVVLSPFDIVAIVESSRRRNEADAITGALFCTARTFLQVLEGPRAVLNVTFTRIVRDPRQHAVQLLRYGRLGDRAFPGWHMRSVTVREAVAMRFDALHDEEIEDDELEELLSTLDDSSGGRWIASPT